MAFAFGELKLKTEKTLDTFFLICPLGFEPLVLQELKSLQSWLLGPDMRPSSEPLNILEVRKGGIEIQTTTHVGFQLNHFVKSCVRILWRWKSKKISHVSELKTWLRGLRPSEITKSPIRLQISSRKSRLQNEKMILRVFQEDWKTLTESEGQALFVDVYDDQFTLSWDLSGDPLYKRGMTEFKGIAPLRENLAHLLLHELVQGATGPELQEAILVDPMMGSGTFLWESLGWNQTIHGRKFSYENFVSVPGFLKTEWWKNLKRPNQSLFGEHLGLDQSPEMMKVAQQNRNSFQNENVKLEKNDLLNPSFNFETSKNVYLISNPPFGERISVKSIQILINQSLKQFSPMKALFLVPRSCMLECENYHLESTREFLHGGLEVKSLVFSRSRQG